jgi:hypothetical protein
MTSGDENFIGSHGMRFLEGQVLDGVRAPPFAQYIAMPPFTSTVAPVM